VSNLYVSPLQWSSMLRVNFQQCSERRYRTINLDDAGNHLHCMNRPRLLNLPNWPMMEKRSAYMSFWISWISIWHEHKDFTPGAPCMATRSSGIRVPQPSTVQYWTVHSPSAQERKILQYCRDSQRAVDVTGITVFSSRFLHVLDSWWERRRRWVL